MNNKEEDSGIISNNQNHPIIILNDKYEDTNDKYEKNQELNYDNKISPNLYIATSILSILMFSLCAWASEISFLEIIDLEMPLLILLTLILTECCRKRYFKISFVISILASICIYLINPSYSFYIIISITSVIVVNCFERICLNEYDFRFKKHKKTNNKYFDHLQRIKYHLLISLVFFVVFMLLGYLYPTVFQPIVLPSIQGMSEGVQEGTVQLETVSLFVNNISVAINMVFGGFYFSTSTIYLLIFNALVVGYSACANNLEYFLSFTLPHGIIELSAIIIAGAAGFRVTDAIISILSGIKVKNSKKSTIFVEHVEICYKMLFDVLIMLVIITILLIVAAYIEANLTIPVGQYLMGI